MHQHSVQRLGWYYCRASTGRRRERVPRGRMIQPDIRDAVGDRKPDAMVDATIWVAFDGPKCGEPHCAQRRSAHRCRQYLRFVEVRWGASARRRAGESPRAPTQPVIARGDIGRRGNLSHAALRSSERNRQGPAASRSSTVARNPNGSGVTPRIQSHMRSTLISMKVAFARSASVEK